MDQRFDGKMYKIRLYVVPEQEETVEELDSEDEEEERPQALLQRRNSRRPGAVRVNVLQKDRRAEIAQTKTRQNGAKRELPIALCEIQPGQRSVKSVVSQKENQDRSTVSVAKREGPRLPPRNVFASPKIKQLALDLQEKMMERNSKIRTGGYQASKQIVAGRGKILSGKIPSSEPTKGSTLLVVDKVNDDSDGNNNNNSNTVSNTTDETSIRSKERKNFDDPSIDSTDGRIDFSNARRKPDGNEIFSIDHDRLLPRNASAGSTNKRGVCEYLDNRAEMVILGMNRRNSALSDGRSAKIVRVKADEESDDVGEDVIDGDVTSVAKDNAGRTETVVLRRGNKLNGYREYDLEQKIEVEIKMREGSARLLAAARHRAQSLEAARALLTSNERMSAYMAELQRRKREPSNRTSAPGSTARVSLSELRVPLMWRDSDHFKNRGDYRRFAVFCLARVGTEIHDTALLCPVDRALTDISFPDVLVFNNVPAEFELTLEIYSHILQEDLSIASTPRRIKRTIHSSISKTVGKKLAASLRDELNSGKIGPHFELMASARLTLDDTDDNIHTHDLVINSLEHKHHSLPLFGHFCCRLAAQPECISKEVCSGNISFNGRIYWARLQGFSIQTWESRKLADEEQHSIHTIPINRETSIHLSKSSSKELRIMNSVDGSERVTTIKLESNEDAQRWLRQLVAHAKDHLRWKRAAESIQEVPCVESARNSFISNKRQGSLYDETPLIESVQTDFSSTRPTVQEIFGLTPSTSLSSCSSTNSPPSLRSRSLSTSGPRKLSASALKAHWPFSNKNHD